MTSQRNLGRMFKRGETSGTASNVEIRDFGNFTAIVGYGHAVYAVRVKDTGEVIGFGWDGYSRSTSCQLTKMGIEQDFKTRPSPCHSNFRDKPAIDEICFECGQVEDECGGFENENTGERICPVARA